MDVTPYLELKIAPRAIFDRLQERRAQVRFMLPGENETWKPVTYQEFADDIRRASLGLRDLGLKNGEVAAILSPNRVEWITAAMAIQAAGGVMVPIYPASTAEQIEYIADHSDAKVLFVDGTRANFEKLAHGEKAYARVERVVFFDSGIDPRDVVPEQLAQKLCSWTSLMERGEKETFEAFERMLHSVSLEQVGLMLYTSGTSGRPKGVPLTHYNIAANGRDWLSCNAQLLEEGAVDLMWLPMSHIFGFGEVCLGNTLGFKTYFADPMNALELLPKVKPQVFMSVPASWEKIARAIADEPHTETRKRRLAELTGGELKFCLSGGAGLKREIKELFYECGVLIIEGYGLTETSPTLTLNRPDQFRFDSVGKPIPSVELELAEDGEIWAKGPNVFAGYHKDPEATKEAFTADGWFKTGDIGRFTEDGFLQIIDRKKDILVTSGGKNVAPANIEMRFRDDPNVAHVVVYGDGHRYLVAGIWPMGEPNREALKASVERVNGELASFETIKRFAIMNRPLSIANGLLTPTLKVKRKKVYEEFRAEFEALYE